CNRPQPPGSTRPSPPYSVASIVAQRPQVEQKILHGLVAFISILFQRLSNDPLDFTRRIGRELRDWRRVAIENCREHIAAGLALEGTPASHHLVEHDAQRPNIRSGIHLQTASLFRRHVWDTPDDQAGFSAQGAARWVRSRRSEFR